MNGFFPFNSSHFTSETKFPSDLRENIVFLLIILNHIQQTDYGHMDLLCKVQKRRKSLTFIYYLVCSRQELLMQVVIPTVSERKR